MLILSLCQVALLAAAVEGPLPAANAFMEIPAQEWPFAPGPRNIRVGIFYPGDALTKVDAETGLFLTLHNWGGTDAIGAPDPQTLADRYKVVAITVNYCQSGKWEPKEGIPYDFGYLQALDALRALHFVWQGLASADIPFHHGRIYATGGSGGGNVSLMANKLAPRTFACVVDLCGMPKLSDDIAFGLEGGSELNANYSRDPAAPNYLSPDAQALRFIGNPDHLAAMKALGNEAKVVLVHGAEDEVCPTANARDMVDLFSAAGFDIDAHFVTEDKLDGIAFKSTGHSLGDRTLIVQRVADVYLTPGSAQLKTRNGPCDFESRDQQVRYETPNGVWVIDYAAGFPIGRFEKK